MYKIDNYKQALAHPSRRGRALIGDLCNVIETVEQAEPESSQGAGKHLKDPSKVETAHLAKGRHLLDNGWQWFSCCNKIRKQAQLIGRKV